MNIIKNIALVGLITLSSGQVWADPFVIDQKDPDAPRVLRSFLASAATALPATDELPRLEIASGDRCVCLLPEISPRFQDLAGVSCSSGASGYVAQALRLADLVGGDDIGLDREENEGLLRYRLRGRTRSGKDFSLDLKIAAVS